MHESKCSGYNLGLCHAG